MGASIIAWVLYNLFIERLPDYKPVALMGTFGIGPVLCWVGYSWIKKAFEKNDHNPRAS